MPTQVSCYSYLRMYLEVVLPFITVLKSRWSLHGHQVLFNAFLKKHLYLNRNSFFHIFIAEFKNNWFPLVSYAFYFVHFKAVFREGPQPSPDSQRQLWLRSGLEFPRREKENTHLVPTTVASLNRFGNFLNSQARPMWEGEGNSLEAPGQRRGELAR